MATSREDLGRMVREEWIAWASQQPNPKPSWLIPWEDLDDGQKEIDMRIGVRLYNKGIAEFLHQLYRVSRQKGVHHEVD